jgi:hypothetical protein
MLLLQKRKNPLGAGLGIGRKPRIAGAACGLRGQDCTDGREKSVNGNSGYF